MFPVCTVFKCVDVPVCTITHIINLSITTGSIPDDLKMARIVPLYKKNSKTHVGNYRPISVLSVISKVFEKVVFMQLSDYLSENRLLYLLFLLYVNDMASAVRCKLLLYADDSALIASGKMWQI